MQQAFLPLTCWEKRKENDSTLFSTKNAYPNPLSYQHLHVPHGRVTFSADNTILAIQVTRSKRASGITNNHSVRIEHWDNFEYEFFSQLLEVACYYNLKRNLEKFKLFAYLSAGTRTS